MTITMKEVREEIDLLDKELVLLLARRQKCIEMAAVVKNDKDLVIDEERIEEVVLTVGPIMYIIEIVIRAKNVKLLAQKSYFMHIILRVWHIILS